MNVHGSAEEPNQPDGGLPARKLRVCFLLAYRAPDYVRGQTLIAALDQHPDIELVLAISQSRGPLRYLDMLRKLRRARKQQHPDLYILGFRGHEIAWLVRWLTRGKPLVLDAMMSPYAALAEEQKAGLPGRLLAPLWRSYEHAILHRSELVLTDTVLHKRYYCEAFNLPEERVIALPVGATEPDAAPVQLTRTDAPFRVLFYGSFLPLHGVDVIVAAAAQLTDLPIEFRFIGGSRAQGRRLMATSPRDGSIRFTHVHWLPASELIAHEIPAAQLCLGGPFGGTAQARRVVTGKTLQCLALGKATVVGRIDEDNGFIDRSNCLLIEQRDPTALASAIRWAFTHRDELAMLGSRGQGLYTRMFSIGVVAGRLVPRLQQLAALA